MRIDGYKLGVLFGVFAALLFLGLPALGHDDGGVDEPWTEAMNQTTYWEARYAALGDVTCTKYENHRGNIPAGYELVVTKGGTDVRVYGPGSLGAFQAVGPAFTVQGQHKHREISWVMKCNIEWTTTTTAAPTTTTTEATTTTTLTEMTTSTVDTTTTTAPTTTTTTPALSSTTMPPTTTTQPGVTTTSEPPASTTTTGPTSTTVPDVSASWSAWAECGGWITVEWGDGVAAVDVYMWFDISLGEAEAGWHQIARYDQPGVYSTPVASRTTFLLIPVTVTSYEVTPMERELHLEPCHASSTSIPEAHQTPSTPDLDELPLTGLPVHVWAILGLVALGSGTALVRWARA